MLTLVFPLELGDITFAANTCLVYFLQEDLELPLPAKSPAMMFVL